jgi:hypothetical protein
MNWQQTGGARIGRTSLFSINYTWPFARIILSSERIELKYTFGRLVLGRGQILRIEPYAGFFSNGMRLYHAIANKPRFVVYWPSDFHDFERHLQELGYVMTRGSGEGVSL